MFTITGYDREVQFEEIHDVVDYVLNFYKYELEGGAYYQNDVYEEMKTMREDCGIDNPVEKQVEDYMDENFIDWFTHELDHMYDSEMEMHGFQIKHKAVN